jgi:hypothetical protein
MSLTDVCALLDLNVRTMVIDEEIMIADEHVMMLFDDTYGEHDEQ